MPATWIALTTQRSNPLDLLALKRRVNPTRVPIEAKESIRWLENMRQATALLGDPARLVHVGDRENDIYEFFCAAQAAGTHFLVRACVDRLAGDGRHTIADEMGEVAVQGLHRVEVAGEDGKPGQASVELRYRRIHVLCDNARPHDCRRVAEYLKAHGDRIVLHYLPKRAPECNPIERVWWHLHEEITRNHRCKDIDELLDLVFGWLSAGSSFAIETSIYDSAQAA